jgi:predicted phage tail protein
MMSTADFAPPAVPVPMEKRPAEVDEAPPLSKGAGIFVMIVALVGAILATIDVFVNGWLSALAHLGWFAGVFLVISLVTGLVLGFVLGGRPVGHPEAPAPGTP